MTALTPMQEELCQQSRWDFSMISIERSARPWVREGSGERFSVQGGLLVVAAIAVCAPLLVGVAR